MRPYQIKWFKQGEQSILDDLQKSIPIKSDALIALLNDVLRARGEMTEQIVHRDADFEIEGTTTEKFSTADALAHDLAGRKLSDPRQSRGFIFVSPSKGQKREAPEGADSHA